MQQFHTVVSSGRADAISTVPIIYAYLREISSLFLGVRVGVYCLLLSWTDFYGELSLTAIACDIDSFVEPIFQALLT